MLFFFNFLSISDFLCRFASSKKSKNIYSGKDTSIIRWPKRRVTALRIVRTSFLGPRPRLFPPPPQPGWEPLSLSDFIYSGELLVDKENVFEVFTTANHLQMAIIVRQCCDFLDKEYIQGCNDLQTYLHLLKFADLHGLKDLKEATLCKIASLYKDVCAKLRIMISDGAWFGCYCTD